jgi:hypothetical protein
MESTTNRLCVRKFLDAPESGNGAHVILLEETNGWYALTLSDGHGSITLDFQEHQEASLAKLDRIAYILNGLRERIAS